jgi:hypothetical protein
MKSNSFLANTFWPMRHGANDKPLAWLHGEIKWKTERKNAWKKRVEK